MTRSLRFLAGTVASLALAAGCTAHHATPGGTPPRQDPNSPDATLAQMVACFRAHGLPDFPDPAYDPNDRRWHLAHGSPPLTAQVEQACAAVMPRSTPASPIPSGQLHDLLEFARCMRGHGLPGFPDPGSDGRFPASHLPDLKTDPAAPAAGAACDRYLASSGGSIQVGNDG